MICESCSISEVEIISLAFKWLAYHIQIGYKSVHNDTMIWEKYLILRFPALIKGNCGLEWYITEKLAIDLFLVSQLLTLSIPSTDFHIKPGQGINVKIFGA